MWNWRDDSPAPAETSYSAAYAAWATHAGVAEATGRCLVGAGSCAPPAVGAYGSWGEPDVHFTRHDLSQLLLGGASAVSHDAPCRRCRAQCDLEGVRCLGYE